MVSRGRLNSSDNKSPGRNYLPEKRGISPASNFLRGKRCREGAVKVVEATFKV